jgi:phosphatidylglycerol lysyltransferase
VWRFIELANSHGGKAAFYQIPPSSLPLYLDAGLEVLKLGEMASVFLPSFTLEGSLEPIFAMPSSVASATASDSR